VYKDIAFGPKNMGLKAEEIDRRVREAAKLVGLTDEQLEVSPFDLSGGQKRRVAIAGVIAMRPGLLVLDEPTAGLDPAGCRQILDNILSYREKTGSAVIMISHSMDDVARLAERIVVFHRGNIVMDGSPSEIFCHAEKLTEIGLDIPKAAELAVHLRREGVRLPQSIYTHEQLLDALLGRGEACSC
jgi:energy-coupling factor transport system ATP-binding protein